MTFNVTIEESIEHLKKELNNNGFSINEYEIDKVRNFVEKILEEKIYVNYELDFINKVGKVLRVVGGKQLLVGNFSFTGTRTREHIKKLVLLNNIVKEEEEEI